MKTNYPRQAIWILALAAALAAAAAACGGSKDDPPQDDDTKYDVCKLDDGTIDCANPVCDSAPVCKKECVAQVPTCAPTIRGAVDRVCVADKCQAAGPRTDEGPLSRGNLMAVHTFDSNIDVKGLKSYAITVHHGTRPNGEKLTCADLLKLDDAEDTSFSNIIARATENVTADNGQIVKAPVNNVPINDKGKTLLLLSRFFNVSKSETGEPRGNVAARGCVANLEVPEGGYVADAAHSPDVEVQPACTVGDPNACADGKVCVWGVGLCRYQCQPECTNSEQVCRPKTTGAPTECLRRCYPDKPSLPGCPTGERCDATPGEDPACMPL